MNKSILLVLATLALTQAAITFDSTVHCSCEELLQADCTSMAGWCKWTTTCETVEYDSSCSAKASADCTGPKTGYTCGLDGTTCTEKTYSCADFASADTCPQSLNCYWNKSGKCAEFSSCADYEAANCYHYGCTARSGTCAAFKCGDYLAKNDCYGSDTDTTQCVWSNDGKCNSVNENSTCSDLNNYTDACNNSGGCTYENNACRAQTCADIKEEVQCTRVRTSDTTRTLCSWGTACADAADTSKLTQANCLSTSYQNYKWTSDNKCVECSDLVSDDMSSSYILSFIIAAIVLFI